MGPLIIRFRRGVGHIYKLYRFPSVKVIPLAGKVMERYWNPYLLDMFY